MSKKDEVLENCLSKALLTWFSESTVAPFTGAWIETVSRCIRLCRHQVAPFTGARIEMGVILNVRSTSRHSLVQF